MTIRVGHREHEHVVFRDVQVWVSVDPGIADFVVCKMIYYTHPVRERGAALCQRAHGTRCSSPGSVAKCRKLRARAGSC